MGYMTGADSGEAEREKTGQRVAKVVGKVIEAKGLVLPKLADALDNLHDLVCEISLVGSFDEADGKYQTIASREPFWAEDFSVDSKSDFTDVKVMVCKLYKSNEGIKRQPIGKVTIPRNLLPKSLALSNHTLPEQWYMLQDAQIDDRVSGKIQLAISYHQEDYLFKHVFTVKVVKAKDLACNGPDEPNCYVAMHLLPDPIAMSCQKSNTQSTSNSPVFSETFTFSCGSGEKEDGLILHCSVWDDNFSSDASKSFLGHVCIPLAPVMKKKSVNKWYPLASLNNDADLSAAKSTNNKIVLLERNHPKDLVKKISASLGKDGSREKAHKLVNKAFLSTCCTVCNEPIVGREMACSECEAPVHIKCKDAAANICGGVGLIKLQIDINRFVTLDFEKYGRFIEILSANEYLILETLGKVSSTKAEEAARLLTKVFGISDYKDFVIDTLRREIRASSNPATLFRPSCMASKALDVLIKTEAFEYLQSTLEVVLRFIVGASNAKKVEIDPSRLTSDSDLEENTANLMELDIIIADTIFASIEDVPNCIKEVFKVIKDEVANKFPADANARYTAVSGFFFLRFITLAIMNPALFKLKVGPQTAEATRKLLLISKTLQNLSNFTEFGEKEAFMCVMNVFISSRLERMREFLDQVSSGDLEARSPANHLRVASFLRTRGESDPSKECTELARLLQTLLPRLRDAAADSQGASGDITIFTTLEQELDRLDKQAAIYDKILQGSEIPGDIGVDARDVSFVGLPSPLTKSTNNGSMIDLIMASTDILDGDRFKVSSRYQIDGYASQPSRWTRFFRLLIVVTLSVTLGLGIAFVMVAKGIKLN